MRSLGYIGLLQGMLRDFRIWRGLGFFLGFGALRDFRIWGLRVFWGLGFRDLKIWRGLEFFGISGLGV